MRALLLCFSLFWLTLIWKISPLVIGEILGVFVNKLTADNKYPVQDYENLQLTIEMQLPEKRKTFCNFLFHLWYLHEILNIFKEKLIVIGNVFPKLQTVKSLVRPFSKKPCFRTPFDSQHVKASNVLAKSAWECFYHFFSSFSRKSIWKISPLVLGEILGLFFNTLTAYDKYPVQDCENLPLPVQIQLSEKSKGIFSIFVGFLEST